MDLMCSLFSKTSGNSTRIYGMCVEKNKQQQQQDQAITRINKPINLVASTLPSRLTTLGKSELYHHNKHLINHASSNQNGTLQTSFDDHGAAMFVVVVICFYSLTIGFMLVTHIKCKCVIARKTTGVCCFEIKSSETSYDGQLDETKKTINLLFNDSSKLLTSVVLPARVLNNLNQDSSSNLLNNVTHAKRNDSIISGRNLWQGEEYIPSLDAIV